MYVVTILDSEWDVLILAHLLQKYNVNDLIHGYFGNGRIVMVLFY